jgi:type I restriction enzyme S subunit
MGERELPEGWECVKIGDIATHVSSGSTPRGGEDVYDKEGILFIRSQNIHMNKIIFENIAHISDEIHQSMPRSWVKKGDVLFNITGASIGRVACFNGEDNSANVNQHVCIIRTDKKKVIPEFLSYQLSRPSYQCKILANQSGATRQAFNYTQIKNFEIPLPPLHIQHQIVAVLEQAEAVKQQRHEADALTGALLQNVFYEMFGDPVRNERGHPKKKLDEVCLKIQDGTHYSPEDQTGEIPYITAKNIRRWGIDLSTATYVPKHIHEKIYSRCDPKKGDVIYIKDGVTAGIAKVNIFDFEFSMLSSIAMIRPDTNKLDPFYLEYYLNNPNVYEKIMERKSGSAITRIILREIREIPIVLPPLALQQQFARVVESVERIRERQVASGRQIEGLCEGLMQMVFAGELVA